MRKLTILQNQVSYVGLFSKPAFSLWENSLSILQGLYSAFSPFNVNLADFRLDTTSPVISEASITALISSTESYKLKLDRVESVLSNFDDSELPLFTELLSWGTDWLRATIPDFSFHTHLFTYHNHSRILGGTAKEFLLDFSKSDISELGLNLGSGVIFNWIEPKLERRVQLMLDHSNLHRDGLFIQFSIQSMGDPIDYVETATVGKDLLDRALAKFGFEISDEE